MSALSNRSIMKFVAYLVGAIFLLAINVGVFLFTVPALISAPSTFLLLCGVSLALTTFTFDFVVAVLILRDLYNLKLQPEKENS